MQRTPAAYLLTCAAIVFGSYRCADAQTTANAADTREIAKEAYVYGFPVDAMYLTMHAFSIDKDNSQYKGPFNSVLNFARVFTPDDTAFVTPNSDTPYSFIGLDLRAEPVVITIPAMEKNRYFVFQLMDLYTFNFAYIGTRTTGNGGGNFLIAGPEWKGTVPKGITKVIHSETEFANVVGRTQLFNPADLENVKTIQAGYKVRTLSTFTGTAAPAPAPTIHWVQPVPPAKLSTDVHFFNVLHFLLQFAQIGLGTDQPVDFAALSTELEAALKEGMAEGQNEIGARRTATGGKGRQSFKYAGFS